MKENTHTDNAYCRGFYPIILVALKYMKMGLVAVGKGFGGGRNWIGVGWGKAMRKDTEFFFLFFLFV